MSWPLQLGLGRLELGVGQDARIVQVLELLHRRGWIREGAADGTGGGRRRVESNLACSWRLYAACCVRFLGNEYGMYV